MSVKGQTYPAEIYTQDEINSVLKQCGPKCATGIRNRALITVGYRTGLRITEVLNLYPKDIDTQAGTLTVLHGKGDKRRVVGLDPGTCAILDRWLDIRKGRNMNGKQPLFCTLDGAPLQSVYIRLLLPRLARQAGLDKRLHFHGLRHTFAFELLNEQVSVLVIQQLLGHTSLDTTVKYLSHLNPKDVLDTVRHREFVCA